MNVSLRENEKDKIINTSRYKKNVERSYICVASEQEMRKKNWYDYNYYYSVWGNGHTALQQLQSIKKISEKMKAYAMEIDNYI